MKKVIGGAVVEGTPEEIVAYERMLAQQHPQPHQHPPQQPATAPALVLDDVPDAERIERYQQTASLSPPTAKRYAEKLRLLSDTIHPRPVLSATRQDIKSIRDELLSRCKHLDTFKPHTKTPGVHRCKLGLFQRDLDTPPGSPIPIVSEPGERPSLCGEHCPQHTLSPHVASVFLVATTSFFDHYDELVPRNPARPVLSAFLQTVDLEEHLDETYCPTLEQVGRLIRRARDPRARASLTLLAKTGRRSDVIRALRWCDVDLEEGIINLDRIRQEKLRSAGRGRTKLRKKAFMNAIIDPELSAMLRDYRTNYWELTVARNPDGTPTTDALWLNRHNTGQAGRSALSEWLDAALKDAGMWEKHGAKADARITPHSFRHHFTTIMQSGSDPAPREFVKLLRGDVMGDAMMRYEHIPLPTIRDTYLKHMPRLNL